MSCEPRRHWSAISATLASSWNSSTSGRTTGSPAHGARLRAKPHHRTRRDRARARSARAARCDAVRVRARGAGLAHAARDRAARGARAAVRVRARRLDGDGARRDDLERARSHRRGARLGERQRDGRPRRPFGRERGDHAGHERRAHHDRPLGALTSGALFEPRSCGSAFRPTLFLLWVGLQADAFPMHDSYVRSPVGLKFLWFCASPREASRVESGAVAGDAVGGSGDPPCQHDDRFRRG